VENAAERTNSTGQNRPRAHAALIGLIVVAIVLRAALAAASEGTSDVLFWKEIARQVAQRGLIKAYENEPLLNHPPLAALWARLALLASSGKSFSMMIKLPAIAADALSIVLLRRIWMDQQDARRASLAAVAMALSPVAILISGYHCNTDNVYALLSLLAMYFIANGRRFFLAGLALAAAINIKLVPVLLIPVVFSLCRSWRDARRLAGALLIGATPFLPLLFAPRAIARNMLSYVPRASERGRPAASARAL
jgi:Gpi18-like mannosyltransferase